MVLIAAYYLIVLGALHVLFGLIRFRAPISEAFQEGFVGRFEQTDARRLAFWFIIVGPLLSLLGQAVLHAYRAGDLGLILTVGICLLVSAAVGVLAFPKSPLWALLPPSLIFILGGLSLIG